MVGKFRKNVKRISSRGSPGGARLSPSLGDPPHGFILHNFSAYREGWGGVYRPPWQGRGGVIGLPGKGGRGVIGLPGKASRGLPNGDISKISCPFWSQRGLGFARTLLFHSFSSSLSLSLRESGHFFLLGY